MKTRIRTKLFNLLVILLVLAGNLMKSPTAVLAADATGVVNSAATASDTSPEIGDTITVSINIDVSGVTSPGDNALGSFTGSFDWDPAVLTYSGNSGILAGFTGAINTSNVGTGTIAFNGANAAGATGNSVIMTITFTVIGAGAAGLELAFTAMAAAISFANLLPIVTATETPVTVPTVSTGVVELDGVASSQTGAANATSVSFNHTTGMGSNRLILVGVSWNAGTTARTISSVVFTYDTTETLAFSLVRTQQAGTNLRYAAIYRSTTEPPLNKTGTLTVTFSGAVASGIVAGVINFKGVDQVTPLGAHNGANGSSTAASVTLTGLTGNELVFDTIFQGASAETQTLTAGTGQSQHWNAWISNTRAAASTEQASSSSVIMSWTAASSSIWAIAAVPIKPVAGEPPTCYALNLTSSFGGTAATPSLANSPGCPSGQYIEGQVIGLTAHPDWGYQVQSWSGTDNDSSTALTNVVTMPAAASTVTVTYQSKPCYGLELTSGENGSDPTPDPTFSQACTLGGTYVEGEVITLTAHPDTGYRVASWSGTDNDLSKALTNTLTMPALVSAVHVTYEEIPPEVTLDGSVSSGTLGSGATHSFSHTTGTGANRLTLVGVSWNCGTTDRSISSVTFTPSGGSAIAFSAVITQLGYNTTNPRYSAIYRLLNPPSGTTGTITITFSGSVSNGIMAGAANFKGVDQANPLGTPIGTNGNSSTASVDVTGLSGNELVFDNVFLGASSNTYTLTVGAGQTQLWNPTYVANLREAASIEQATSPSVTMSWAIATQANYWAIAAVPINPAPASPTTHDLTMAVASSGGGTVTPAAGVHTYDAGTVVPITAVPATGYAFNYWTPNDTPGPIADPFSASTTVTMDADYTVTANFVLQTYTLTVNIQGNGSVTRDPDYPAYNYGTLVELTPVPHSGNMFVEWENGSRQVPRLIVINQNTTLSAIFALEQFDFGDAPDTYKTLLASDGARHLYNASSPFLGASIDLDSDGHPSELANGDDSTLMDDEDGVTFPSTLLVAGAEAQVTILGDSGKLDAWIDYDRDGVFDHPSELFLGATMPISGVGGHTYSFVVPANAVAGVTYARFRLSTAGGLGPYGRAEDGEVEDYRVTIEAAPITGTIIIEKQTEPDGMTDNFTFTGDAAGSIADNGQIVVSGLAPGEYSSTETVPYDFNLVQITCNDTNSTVNLLTYTANIQLEEGETVKCTFLNALIMDYGDAPDTYKTLWASEGARHGFSLTEPMLGNSKDNELDGRPSVLADGDDIVDSSDDEDGVTLPATLTVGSTTASVSVDMSGSGKLDAWIDFNGDGDFDHPTEHLWGTSQTLASGTHPLTFAVPEDATPGVTYARFRVSTAGSLQPYGFAADGEVEDYRVTIEAAPITGTIIIEKQTEPDGMTDNFTFTGDAAGTIADNGQIVVSGLAPGEYISTETALSYYKLARITCDDANSTVDLPARTAHIQLEAGETVRCTFLNVSGMDYGDAPDTYKTLWASDGARHMLLDPAIWMGGLRDSEIDGQPSDLANGDDLGGDDEDGVTLPATLTVGSTTASVSVNIFGSSKLDGWIDFDGDGTFEAGEHLWGGISKTLTTGTHPLTFAVPADATVGVTYARFRVSTTGSLQPYGFAPDGEVEDYRVEIEAAPITGTIIIEKQTVPNGHARTFEFTGDVTGTISDGQQIVVPDLAAGTYQVAEVVPYEWKLQTIVCDDLNSTPDLPNNSVEIALEAGETVTCVFTNSMTQDFGDAPDTYQTLFASGGASHVYTGGPCLGSVQDYEFDGQPGTLANGDDITLSDDEDGVSFITEPLTTGTADLVSVMVSKSNGKLDAWIDFDGSGTFDHPTEHLWGGLSQNVSATTTYFLEFSIPTTAVPGFTYARFRWSTAGSLLPYGIAADGEVEDYRIEIVAPTSHTVTFYGNDATSGTMAPQTASAPTALTLNAFLRTGYAFSGWNTTALGNGTAYTDGQTYSFAAHMSLYAQWTANTYTVTFDANSGTAPDPSTLEVTFGSAYGALATTSRTGYTFAGWFTEASGGTQVLATDIVNTASDHTLYAHWSSLPTVEVTVTPGQTKIYGTADPTSFTYTYVPNNPAITFTGALSRVAGEDAGAYAITQGTLAAAGYTITFIPYDFTITQKVASVTPNPASKIYGNADPTLTGSLTGFLSGDNVQATYNRISGETVAGSPYTISATLSPVGVLGNYIITYNTANFTITAKPISVTADAKTKVYGADDPALTYQYTPDLISGDSFSGSLGRASGQNVGPYAINQGTLTLGSNYMLNFTGANLTITARPITVKADDKIKDVGDADPPLTHSITNGSLAYTDAFTGALTRDPGEDVGNYAITQGSLALSANYNMTFVPGTLSIISGSQHLISLKAGWNLVSFNLVPDDPDIEVILAGIADDVILVYAWNGSTDSWLRYDPDVTFGNTLLELHESMGFWINMAADATLTVAGTEPTTTAIPLYTGWNLVGWPSGASSALPGALDGITGNFNLVLAHNAFDTADPWKLYDPNVPMWVNDLTAMLPGLGYWINATENATLSVVNQ